MLQLPLYSLYSLSGEGWKSGWTLQTWECTLLYNTTQLGTKSVALKCRGISIKVTCAERITASDFLDGVVVIKSWSHKTARWLRNVYTGLSNSETFFCDDHNKEVLFKYLAKCTSALQLDDKMILLIVSTSDYVLSSRNHKYLITTRKQFQDYSLVCVMLCKMVMTGSCYAQQMLMFMCRCRAVGCYGYRNAVVLYPSPLSVSRSRPWPKQGTNIFLYLPWVWYHLLF